MRNKWDKKNKSDIFNERMKQRKEKELERKRLFEEAGKPDPNYKKPEDSAPQPPAPPASSTPPSTAAPATPATPRPPVAPAPKPANTADRPGKAERDRRGSSGRHHGRRF